ncbi:hypothetical protein BJP34_22445 [Moorena producens PAL-8-15-08-1]|uniref:Uncharacterized protein n=2 Tax=Moorena TaxID=1155738 RepID=A0A1D8TWI9_9CYAN|nr:hypothetical protein BJP34_22445 [Moorena producens PAL-8-15-08-1]
MILSAQNANFLSFFDRKAGTFIDQKIRKTLSVNALIVNQQALGTSPNLKALYSNHLYIAIFFKSTYFYSYLLTDLWRNKLSKKLMELFNNN